MAIPRRRFLRLAASSAALVAAPQFARAQAYPSRPITIMVFVGAGGAPDIIARLIGQGLSQRIGQPVIIENRPGGGGNLSLQAVARAPADGHTLLLIATPHAINVTLYEKQGVNVVRDIAPIASINNDLFVMLVNPSSPIKSVAEFIAHAKSNPGKVNLTSSGNGNLTHLSGELFRMASGIELVHVPYRNTPAALTAPDGRRSPCDVRCPAIGDAAREGRQPAAARRYRARSGQGAAGRALHLGHRARLCRDRMARGRRAEGHASRRRREAQQGHQRGGFRSGDRRAARQLRQRAVHQHARQFRQIHRGARPRSGRRWSGSPA